MGDLPDYYFRIRENGALVFRVATGERSLRLELEPLAVVNLRNGEVRPQGERALTDADQAAIADWMAERSALLARRDIDDILRTVDHLNLTAQWAQAKASEDELEQVTDPLLLAMHDLRSVLARKKAERLAKA